MQNDNPLYDLIRTVTDAGRGSGGESASTPASANSVLGDALATNTGQLEQLKSLFQTQIDATSENTRQLKESTTMAQSQSSGGLSAADVARGAANTVTGGFVFNPIVSGLLELFGQGGDDAAPPPLEKFSLPDAVKIDAGYSQSLPGIAPIDYGQNGLPRTVPANQPATINVQVQAMDARSFLDRSEDIASAVRRAMLEGSALNDVVAEI